MASSQSIAKSQVVGSSIGKIFGVSPKYDYAPTYTRIYFSPGDVDKIRQKIITMKGKGQSDVRIDVYPIIKKEVIGYGIPASLLLIATGYMIGKI